MTTDLHTRITLALSTGDDVAALGLLQAAQDRITALEGEAKTAREALCNAMWPEAGPGFVCCNGRDCGCLGMPIVQEFYDLAAAVASAGDCIHTTRTAPAQHSADGGEGGVR